MNVQVTIDADTMRKIKAKATDLWHDSAMGDYMSGPEIEAKLLNDYVNGEIDLDDLN